jgi:uncharacterized protein YdeI (YjbR/CyaY-like superfamily)
MAKTNKPKEDDAFYAADSKQWRQWLTKHHVNKKSVWLIIHHKTSNTPSVYYDEAVEQALCFGWVDSKPNTRDAESYYLYFAARNPKSNWSKANRERIEKLVKAELMMPSGFKLIEEAKKNGSWLALEKVEQGIIPEDLQKQFDQKPEALENFLAFAPSSKRIILEWILNAKRPETRLKRITETVELAAKNMKANHYRQ